MKESRGHPGRGCVRRAPVATAVRCTEKPGSMENMAQRDKHEIGQVGLRLATSSLAHHGHWRVAHPGHGRDRSPTSDREGLAHGFGAEEASQERRRREPEIGGNSVAASGTRKLVAESLPDHHAAHGHMQHHEEEHVQRFGRRRGGGGGGGTEEGGRDGAHRMQSMSPESGCEANWDLLVRIFAALVERHLRLVSWGPGRQSASSFVGHVGAGGRADVACCCEFMHSV